MSPVTTRFVVALRAEARPLIDRYQLTRAGETGLTTFRGNGKELVISGVGKVAAAAAAAQIHQSPPNVWLNVGIAGHRVRGPGELVRAHRITDRATGERYYPTLLGLPHIETLGLTTVEAPETEFASDDLFDMEASGFYPSALRSSTSELVQCVKIVSDNASTGTTGLTAARVSELVDANLDAIDEIVEHVESLSTMLETKEPEPDVEAFLETWHFTTSERRKLSRVVNRFRALGSAPTAAELRRLTSASEVLRALDERVQALALEQSEF